MKKFSFLIACLSLTSHCFAQSYLGMESDNYSGIHGVLFNPANITDSRLKVDFNIISYDAMAGTDYLALTFDNIAKFVEEEPNGDDAEKFYSNTNQFIVTSDVLGPSFMFNLSEKHSIGFLTRARVFNNYNNINGQLLEGLVDGFPNESFDIDMRNLNGSTHIWGEIGLAYGRTIFEKDYHFLKGGVTLKYLLGGVFAQGNSESLTGTYNATQNTLTTDGTFSYLLNYDADTEFTSDKLSPGFGADIGFVYEYRPRSSRFSANGEDERGSNKYKVKVGLALVDFGRITYKDVEQDVYNLTNTVDTNTFSGDFVGKLDDNYSKSSTLGDATVMLPASLRLNVDYNIIPKVHASLNYTQTLSKQNAIYTNSTLNLITLAPRFESKIVSVYTPINYSNLDGLTFGAGLRVGPLFLGSGTLFSSLFSKKADLANVYLGFKIPLYQPKKPKNNRRRRR